MPQTRGTFVELHDNLDRAVYTLLGKEYKELSPIWRKYYQVKTSQKRSELVLSVTGMGDVPEKGEGQPYTTDIIQTGYSKEFLHTEFGMMFEVTQTALEEDRYDVLSECARCLMFQRRLGHLE